MTVEQFRELDDPPGFYLELRHGEAVPVTRPKMKHWRLQRRLTQVFEEAFGELGTCGTEFAFRPTPEHNLWAADVAWISRERYDAASDDDNLRGAPDIAVEVLSPSNTAREMRERKRICLENGCQQFWVVDGKKRTIEISRPDGSMALYNSGQKIQIGNRIYSVDDILR